MSIEFKYLETAPHTYCKKKDCECSFYFHEKSQYWHPTLNGNLTPGDFSRCENKTKVYFICSVCNHTFSSTILAAVRTWCLQCSKRNWKHCGNQECNFCYERSFASYYRSFCWHKTKNNIDPLEVVKTCSKKFWFTCDVCNHDFEHPLDSMVTSGRWCPFCSSHWKHCGKEECVFCYEKSFSSHPKAEFWNKEANKNITPKDISKFSEKKFYFDCDKCGHIFLKQIDHITRQEDWCPYCVSTNWKHCGKNECKWCYERSFASVKESVYWHPTKNKNITPLLVPKSSGKIFWMKCTSCDHDFKQSPNRLLNRDKVNGCRYCSSNFWEHCGDDNCNICYNRSFASHPSAKKLHPTKNKHFYPLETVLNSNSVIGVFICDKCNSEYCKTLNRIVQGSGCSVCKNKTETKLKNILQSFIANVSFQKVFDWCKNPFTNKTHYKFDFYLPDYKLIIELDGAQHFKQIANWQSENTTQINDTYKMKCLLKNNLSIIRLFQEDVLFDKNDWEKKLKELIEIVDKEPQNNRIICMRSGQEYIDNVYEKYEQEMSKFLDLLEKNPNIKIDHVSCDNPESEEEIDDCEINEPENKKVKII